MRYYNLRFDIWICLLLGVLISLLPTNIVRKKLTEKYENHKEEKKVEEGVIGGKSTEETFVANNIEDLLNNETFTIKSPGIEYRNKGAGFYKGYYMYAVTLPSKEIVAARINNESVISDSESIYNGISTLPVGKIVYEDLEKDKNFIKQIEYKESLTRKDFYIDMVGEAEIKSEETFIETPIFLMQALIVIISFIILHMIGSKLGIFPYFFPPKEKNEPIWEE